MAWVNGDWKREPRLGEYRARVLTDERDDSKWDVTEVWRGRAWELVHGAECAKCAVCGQYVTELPEAYKGIHAACEPRETPQQRAERENPACPF